MDAINYTTPFWIENTTGNTWTIYIDSHTGGEYDMLWTISVEYSLNGTTWQTFGTTSTTKDSYISQQFSSSQRRVYLRCNTTHWGLYDIDANKSYSYNIRSDYDMRVGGNIMSLLYGSSFVGKKTFPDDTIVGIFNGLFFQRTELKDVTDLVLPVTHTTSAIPEQGGANNSPGNRCYRSMFEGCTSLVNGPHIELRHRGVYDLAYCLQRMFYGCNKLKCYYTNLKSENYRYNSTLSNVGSYGTCYNFSGALGSLIPGTWSIRNITSMYLPTYDRVVELKTPENENVDKITDSNNKILFEYFQEKTIPFYVQNITNSNETLRIKKNSSDAPTLTIQYSRDRINWTLLGRTLSTAAITLTIQPGEKIYLSCDATSWGSSTTYNTISGISKVGGNIMSLTYGSIFTGEETEFKLDSTTTFRNLFDANTNLISADKLILPVTTLVSGCYSWMFRGCTSLTSAPKLPATTLASDCYARMFENCTSLTTAPTLPATTSFGTDCYFSMFRGCTSLNMIKCMLSTGGTDVSDYWVENVSSTGTFIKAAGSTWPSGINGIPNGWAVIEK